MSARHDAQSATREWVNTHKTEGLPLIETKQSQQPPLAGPEMDDMDDTSTQPASNKPYPGIDDGFFNEATDAENVPTLVSRLGPDDEKPNDQPDIGRRVPEKPQYPFPNDNRTDVDLSGIPLDLDSIPDVNVYQHKKTLAQGMMDLALFSANANQLRYVLESSSAHPYFYPSLLMISVSLFLQVAIGVGLIVNSRYNVKDDKEICLANKWNNYTVIGIFIVTSINVFISAFGVASPRTAT